MKQYFKYLLLIVVVLSNVNCDKNYLNVNPTDKISEDKLFFSEEGRKAYLANLYSQLPIEDFKSDPNAGFNFVGNNVGSFSMTLNDNGINSEYMNSPEAQYPWWVAGYKFNRDINSLFSYIPKLTTIDEKAKKELKGQAYFMRAYTYFALAKRYGGVPIITKNADVSDKNAIYVSRSKEKETWDFVMATCDSAAMFLGNGDGTRRTATKWAALALKSRAALHAASVAKYWNEAPLSGKAVDDGLVGMSSSDADGYYEQCIAASEKIMKEGPFTLYKQSPANPVEASENYRMMFENPNVALDEVIFLKGYNDIGHGHSWNYWGQPAQTAGTWPHPGRINPILDLIDSYESYSNPGYSSPIVTTTDGDINNYEGYNPNRTYLTFDNPIDIFNDKDARLFASVNLPGSIWKNTKLILQDGYIKPDGTPVIGRFDQTVVGGVTYYSFGASAANLYSGFDDKNPNSSRTGFNLKKTLDSQFVPDGSMTKANNDWIDFRYAEILLNYAEAVVESGKGDAGEAAKAINKIRRRAGHQVDIPLTLENVLRERRVELAYENKRDWDLIRRREYHKKFDHYMKTGLAPIFDLRIMKYIFVRIYPMKVTPLTFRPMYYYKSIPGIETNKLIQNPQY